MILHTEENLAIFTLFFKFQFIYYNFIFPIHLIARRRADIKRKKLKTLGKSKSTESEEECEEEEADEGKHYCLFCTRYIWRRFRE